MATPTGQLDIERASEDRTGRLVLHGELELATAGRLRESIVEEARRRERVIVDLSDVRFLDSAGLAALLGGAADARLHGAQMTVHSPPGSEARVVISLSGTDRLLALTPA